MNIESWTKYFSTPHNLFQWYNHFTFRDLFFFVQDVLIISPKIELQYLHWYFGSLWCYLWDNFQMLCGQNNKIHFYQNSYLSTCLSVPPTHSAFSPMQCASCDVVSRSRMYNMNMLKTKASCCKDNECCSWSVFYLRLI